MLPSSCSEFGSRVLNYVDGNVSWGTGSNAIWDGQAAEVGVQERGFEEVLLALPGAFRRSARLSPNGVSLAG